MNDTVTGPLTQLMLEHTLYMQTEWDGYEWLKCSCRTLVDYERHIGMLLSEIGWSANNG